MNHKNRSIGGQDTFMFAEKVPHADVFLVCPVFDSLLRTVHGIIKTSYSRILGFRQGGQVAYYYGQKDSYALAIFALDSIHRDPEFGLEIDENIVKWSDALVDLTEKVARKDPGQMKNEEMARIFTSWEKIFKNIYAYGWIPNIIDLWHPEFTKKLKAYLRGKLALEEGVNKMFIILTSPVGRTELSQEFYDLLLIARQVAQNTKLKKIFSQPRPPEISDLPQSLQTKIKNHHQKYRHLEYLETRKEIPCERYVGLIRQTFKEKVDPDKRIKEMVRQERQVQAKRQAALRKYSINAKHRQLFRVFGQFMLSKTKRKLALSRALMLFEPFFQEAAKRLGISRALLSELSPEEIAGALKGRAKVSKAKLEKRKKAYVYFGTPQKTLISTDSKQINRYKKLVKESMPELDVQKITGQPAYPGKACGQVKKVLSVEDIGKVKKGDILLTQTTDPDMVPAMRKAGAIVTDMGGVTSHAAIMARELKTPCVIGTKFALKVLKDGDKVEVDADRGVVRKV